MQLTHNASIFTKRKFPITLVCDQVSDASNLGGLLRVADAFGVEKVYFCGEDIRLTKKSFRASRAAEKEVAYDIGQEASDVVTLLKRQGYQMIALEITSDSRPIHSLEIQIEKPVVIVVGDENFGISESLLKASDQVVHIDMYGQNSSMNVVQATSIALYEICKHFM